MFFDVKIVPNVGIVIHLFIVVHKKYCNVTNQKNHFQKTILFFDILIM